MEMIEGTTDGDDRGEK
jgi:hypothetical protein